MEQMIVTIKDGTIKMEIDGVQGVRCVELTRGIETLIGKVDTKNYKKDFYSNIENKQDVNLDLYGRKTNIDRD